MAAVRILDIDLPPDVFAVVMATGIVSVAADDHHYWRIGAALAVLASVAFVVLALGLGVRLFARTGVIVAQSRDPDVALRMFTFVAGASVLGVVWRRFPVAVWVAGALSTAGWLVLMPLGIRDARSRSRRDLRDGARGAWLLVSVGTSGLAITVTNLAVLADFRALAVAALALWLLAIALYAAVTFLIAWRAIAGPLRPEAVTPDSWILMGALAIATLAGAHLVQGARDLGSLAWLAGGAGPVTVVWWAAASLWIPALVYAQIWRIDRCAGSLRFAGAWWSAVFPLGMYAAATAATGTELDMPALATISLVFFWIAAAVWAAVAAGLAQFAVTRWRRPG